MVRTLVALSLLASIAPTAAWADGKPHDISWGKPDVSYAQYRADALDCANMTYGVSVSMEPRTIRALASLNSSQLFGFLSGLSFYEHGMNVPLAIAAVEPDHVVFRNTTYTETFNHAARSDVIEQLQRLLDACLVQRGYQRFRLTSLQLDRLHALKRGTEAREHYLHALGSDRQVIAQQRV